MEGEFDKIYDMIYKLNEKVSALEKKNEEISSNLDNPKPADFDLVTDQEHVIADPHSLGEYKNISLPNGSAMKVKSYPMCVNGRHIISNLNDIVFCSRCGGAICREHNLPINPPLCINCIHEIIGQASENELVILSAISDGLPYWNLSKALKLSWKDIRSGVQKLLSLGYIKRSFLKYETTLDGERILSLAKFVYDLDVYGRGD